MKTLIGDALLTAACICYLGPLEQERREQLLYEWKTICQEKTEEDDDGDDDTTFTANAQSSVNTRCKSTSASFPVGIYHVPCRSDFNLKEILSCKEELYTWRNSGLSVNSRAVENALTMRTVCDEASGHWPLLVDTDLQSYAWVKCFHEKRANEGERTFLQPSYMLNLLPPWGFSSDQLHQVLQC
jgi:dynein heavy chain